MVVDIGGVGQGVSELLQAVYAAVLKLKFSFPTLRKQGRPSWCQMGRQ